LVVLLALEAAMVAGRAPEIQGRLHAEDLFLCSYCVSRLFFSSAAMVNRRISADLKECALRLWELCWEELEIT
jgi:hypothetical protein